MAYAGRKALIKVISDAAAVAFTEEACSEVTGSGRTIYEIDDRSLKYWSKADAITVEVDIGGIGSWSALSSGQYLLQHCGGRVHLREALGVDDELRVSGKRVVVTTAAEANDCSFAINTDLADVTVFDPEAGTEGFRRRMPQMTTASGTIGGFYITTNLLQDRLLDGDPVIIEMTPDGDTAAEILACYAYLSGKEMSAAVSDAAGSSVPWESDGEILVEE